MAYSDGSATSALLRATLDFWLRVLTFLETCSAFRTAEAEASSYTHTCHPSPKRNGGAAGILRA